MAAGRPSSPRFPARPGSAGGGSGGAGGAVFSALSGQAGFGGLVLGGDLRVISPGHGLDAGLFAGDYLGGYIDEVWSHYTSNTMTVTAGANTFSGQVSGGKFVFS